QNKSARNHITLLAYRMTWRFPAYKISTWEYCSRGQTQINRMLCCCGLAEIESRGALFGRLSNYLDLVQECHVGHRAALRFRVHHDTVPERQGDGGVVGMAHRATGINTHVTAHHAPAPTRST